MVKKKIVKVLQWLDNGCYPGFVLFSCGFTYEEVVALLKKKKANQWLIGLEAQKDFVLSSNYCAFTTEEGVHCAFIFIKEQFKFTDYEYCKLAHEVFHICQFSLSYILDIVKEKEAAAYYHTHIMNQCLKALRGK